MTDESSGPVLREVTETYYIEVCPKCGERLMSMEPYRCYFCSWRSPHYIPTATKKQWKPNPHLRAERWAVSRGRCFYCGEFIENRSQRGLDHLIPQSRGSDSLLSIL
jgi:5-methylcytosine-specific restriction endonuclease McrA